MVCYPGINHSLGYWRNCHWFCKKSKVLSVRFYFVTQVFIESGNAKLTFLLLYSYFYFIHTYWYEHANLTFANLAQFANLFPLIDKVGHRTVVTAEIIDVILFQREKNASRVSLVIVFSPWHPLIQWLALFLWYIAFISHSLRNAIAFNSKMPELLTSRTCLINLCS